ncbi:MAG TPA: hypothetical protein VNV61_07435 [Steroidobacteraceae bacterium]|jgi:hypothetical protein|nr:hypothetical protein [Steroidobacteraceae bacterium]
MTTYSRVVSAIAAALLLAACAANTSNVKPATTAADTQNPACLSQTGSRIAGDRADCTAYGRSYSSTDIQTTGKVDAADALKTLDPSITVHH